MKVLALVLLTLASSAWAIGPEELAPQLIITEIMSAPAVNSLSATTCASEADASPEHYRYQFVEIYYPDDGDANVDEYIDVTKLSLNDGDADKALGFWLNERSTADAVAGEAGLKIGRALEYFKEGDRALILHGQYGAIADNCEYVIPANTVLLAPQSCCNLGNGLLGDDVISISHNGVNLATQELPGRYADDNSCGLSTAFVGTWTDFNSLELIDEGAGNSRLNLQDLATFSSDVSSTHAMTDLPYRGSPGDASHANLELDLRITEVAGRVDNEATHAKEFIELYNNGASTINLSKFTITNGCSPREIVAWDAGAGTGTLTTLGLTIDSNALTLAPGEYAVLLDPQYGAETNKDLNFAAGAKILTIASTYNDLVSGGLGDDVAVTLYDTTGKVSAAFGTPTASTIFTWNLATDVADDHPSFGNALNFSLEAKTLTPPDTAAGSEHSSLKGVSTTNFYGHSPGGASTLADGSEQFSVKLSEVFNFAATGNVDCTDAPAGCDNSFTYDQVNEAIELYNAGNTYVNVRMLGLRDIGTDGNPISGSDSVFNTWDGLGYGALDNNASITNSPVLAPGEYAVILDSDYLSGDQPHNLPKSAKLFSLTSNAITSGGLATTDALNLVNLTDGSVIDSFGTPTNLADDFPYAPVFSNVSFERVDSSAADQRSNWQQSDYAFERSLGAPNSTGGTQSPLRIHGVATPTDFSGANAVPVMFLTAERAMKDLVLNNYSAYSNAQITAIKAYNDIGTTGLFELGVDTLKATGSVDADGKWVFQDIDLAVNEKFIFVVELVTAYNGADELLFGLDQIRSRHAHLGSLGGGVVSTNLITAPQRTSNIPVDYLGAEVGCVWPLSGSATPHTLSDGFGPRYLSYAPNQYDFHQGIDMLAPAGTDVHAVMDGVVVRTVPYVAGSSLERYGNFVLIEHAPKSGVRRHTAYLHLSSYSVTVGDSVAAGEIIGKVGKTGTDVATNHLHLNYYEDMPHNLIGREYLRNPLKILPYTPVSDKTVVITDVTGPNRKKVELSFSPDSFDVQTIIFSSDEIGTKLINLESGEGLDPASVDSQSYNGISISVEDYVAGNSTVNWTFHVDVTDLNEEFTVQVVTLKGEIFTFSD